MSRQHTHTLHSVAAPYKSARFECVPDMVLLKVLLICKTIVTEQQNALDLLLCILVLHVHLSPWQPSEHYQEPSRSSASCVSVNPVSEQPWGVQIPQSDRSCLRIHIHICLQTLLLEICRKSKIYLK